MMFTADQLPRTYFPERGGAWMASHARAATNGNVFYLYNPLAALVASRQLVLVTGLYLTARDGTGNVIVKASDDAADLENLTNLLDATNSCPCLLGAALDGLTVMAVENNPGTPALQGECFAAVTDTDSDKNVPIELEFPVVIPPGHALVVETPSDAGRTDRVSWRWFRA